MPDFSPPPADLARALDEEFHSGVGPGSLQVLWQDSTRSTMESVREALCHPVLPDCGVMLALDGPEDLIAVIAGEQLAGRGRAGRAWLSNRDAGIYLTVGWRTTLPAAQFSGLPLPIGARVLLSLRERHCFSCPVGLKWPNDIVVRMNGRLRKLGGILVETAGHSGNLTVMIGVGVNISGGNTLPESIALGEVIIGETDRARCTAAVLCGVVEGVREFTRCGLTEVLRRWEDLSLVHGGRVSVNDGSFVGTAVGLAHDGGLIVEGTTGTVTVHAGDVVILHG